MDTDTRAVLRLVNEQMLCAMQIGAKRVLLEQIRADIALSLHGRDKHTPAIYYDPSGVLRLQQKEQDELIALEKSFKKRSEKIAKLLGDKQPAEVSA